MDQGVIVSCKRCYQRRYLDEVLVVLEEEEDLDEDKRGQRTLNNIKNYNFKSAIYNFASSWKDVKITTLSHSWNKLLLDEDPELNFLGFEPQDYHQSLLSAGERGVSLEDVENWLEDNDADPGYQVLSTEEIAEAVLVGKQSGESSSSDEEEEVAIKPKMSHTPEPQSSEPQPSTSKGSSVATISALDFVGFESEDSDSE
ncbi:hypothetical protein Pcinc_009210 [Petrolisthes cinctipes]|uniref:DDE-1 domain-containing protein n=1 Tax=Petrolisthes cinctipes TaxID=88211 RepID=A0AAE1KV17_PETCI|nr:hypothetical protein Pcinc_009210 [Petrolisthes cinctipes]